MQLLDTDERIEALAPSMTPWWASPAAASTPSAMTARATPATAPSRGRRPSTPASGASTGARSWRRPAASTSAAHQASACSTGACRCRWWGTPSATCSTTLPSRSATRSTTRPTLERSSTSSRRASTWASPRPWPSTTSATPSGRRPPATRSTRSTRWPTTATRGRWWCAASFTSTARGRSASTAPRPTRSGSTRPSARRGCAGASWGPGPRCAWCISRARPRGRAPCSSTPITTTPPATRRALSWTSPPSLGGRRSSSNWACPSRPSGPCAWCCTRWAPRALRPTSTPPTACGGGGWRSTPPWCLGRRELRPPIEED